MISSRFKTIGVVLGILSVFALGAMAVGPADSALAAKMAKAPVCHFQTGTVVEIAEWKIIEVNGNSLPAHLGDLEHPGHGDGQFMDQLIDDSAAPAAGTVSSTDCLAR